MNKNEKLLADSIGQALFDKMDKLTDAIKLNAAATQYLADVRGYKADAENPVDEEGKQKVKLELATDVPADDAPLIPTSKEITFDDLRNAVNVYAGNKGKEDTLAIVKKFAPSGALKDVAEADYQTLITAVA